jgi:hypothetical protein
VCDLGCTPKVGLWGRQAVPPAKRFVDRGREPSARQAERSGKRGGLGGGSPPAKRFVARGSELSPKQAECSEKRGFGGGSPHLRLKNPGSGHQLLIDRCAVCRQVQRPQITCCPVNVLRSRPCGFGQDFGLSECYDFAYSTIHFMKLST